jgi:thioesterase domain-containing protein
MDDGLMLGMEVLEQARQAGIEAPFSLTDLWYLQPQERLGYAFEKAKDASIWPPEIGLAEVHRYLELHKGRRHAIQTYHPQPFAGPLTLLRSSEQTNDIFAELDEVVDGKILQQRRAELQMTLRIPTLGWQQFSQTPVEVHLLKGDHHSMLVLPHVKTLAERLQACIAKAETE